MGHIVGAIRVSREVKILASSDNVAGAMSTACVRSLGWVSLGSGLSNSGKDSWTF